MNVMVQATVANIRQIQDESSLHTRSSFDRVHMVRDVSRVDQGIDATNARNTVTFKTPVCLTIARQQKKYSCYSRKGFDVGFENCHLVNQRKR